MAGVVKTDLLLFLTRDTDLIKICFTLSSDAFQARSTKAAFISICHSQRISAEKLKQAITVSTN
jgi:hypothetical protein